MERQIDRQTPFFRQTDGETDIQTDTFFRQTDGETDRETDRHIFSERQTLFQTDRWRDIQMDRQTDRTFFREIDGETDRHTLFQTDR